jgi:hypothetical protein
MAKRRLQNLPVAVSGGGWRLVLLSDVESVDDPVVYRERRETVIIPGDLDCQGDPGGESCELEEV